METSNVAHRACSSSAVRFLYKRVVTGDSELTGLLPVADNST